MSNKFQKVFESEEFREEFFVANTQAHLASLLEERGVSRAELARKLNVSRARVTQIFSDEAKNLTLRLLARSFFALDEEPVILTKSEYDRLLSQGRSLGSGQMSDRRASAASDILTTSLIAELLRASETKSQDHDKSRRADSAREWAEGGPNVVPIRRTANG